MAKAIYVLVVDSDQFLQEMVESGLELFNPDYVTIKAENPETALMMLRRYPVEAVVMDIEFPHSPIHGSELLQALHDFSPQLPVIVLTEARPEELEGVGANAFLPKPPDMDQLLNKVNQLVQQNKESVLRGISLESFLQVLEVEKKTCTLTVTAAHRVGRLYIHQGELIHAEAGELESKAAAFAMLSWPDYSIKVIEKCDAKPTIAERLNAILMEWCVHKDHGLL